MSYALINSKGEIIEVRGESFYTDNPRLEVVKIDGVSEGDELNYYYVVTQLGSANKDGHRVVTAYSGIRQTTALQRLRLDNERLQQENIELKTALAELAEAQEQAQTATQLALAEIVESLGGEK